MRHVISGFSSLFKIHTSPQGEAPVPCLQELWSRPGPAWSGDPPTHWELLLLPWLGEDWEAVSPVQDVFRGTVIISCPCSLEILKRAIRSPALAEASFWIGSEITWTHCGRSLESSFCSVSPPLTFKVATPNAKPCCPLFVFLKLFFCLLWYYLVPFIFKLWKTHKLYHLSHLWMYRLLVLSIFTLLWFLELLCFTKLIFNTHWASVLPLAPGSHHCALYFYEFDYFRFLVCV